MKTSTALRRVRSLSGVALCCVLGVVGAFSAGCGDSFDPASYLSEARVLAVTSDPTEVVLASDPPAPSTLTASAWVYVPVDAKIVSESWRYCAFGTGPYGAYECVYPEDCEVDVTAAAAHPTDGPYSQVAVDPAPVGARCAARLSRESGGLGLDPGAFAGGGGAEEDVVLDTYLRYRVETDDGTVRDAVVKVPVWLRGAPDAVNQAPVIQRVEFDDAEVVPGAVLPPVPEDEKRDLRVVTAADSIDTFVDGYGRTREEDVIVSFFATAGRFDQGRKVGEDVTVEWEPKELEDDEVEALLYVVARDLRGGQAVFGPFRVPIQRKPAP